MNATVYGRIWTYLGAATSLTALNIVIQSQGGLLFSGGYLIEKRPVIACYYGAFLIAFLLIAVCWAGIGYARATLTKPWPLRLPVIGDDGKDPINGSANSIRVYQAFFLVVIIVVPAYGLVHCNDKVWSSGVIWSDADNASNNATPVKCTIIQAAGCDPKKWDTITSKPVDNRFWLAETVHDPKYWQSQRAGEKPLPNPELGYRMHDLSEACRKDSETCRGVAWGNPGSILAMWALAALAFGFIGVLLWTLARRPSAAG